MENQREFTQTSEVDLFDPSKDLENEQSNEISELSKKGYQLLKENKIQEAKEEFSKILDIEENNNYALVGLGDSERKLNHYNDAINYYSKCLSFHPGNNYALFGLADCYKALNQYHKAITIWEQYLIHDDRNITVLTRVADAYRKIREFKKSKNLYLKVLDMEENNPYALIGLGHLHYDFKEYRDALYYWTKMLDLNSSCVDIRVLTSIGNCHRKLKTFDKGVSYFERALELDPKNFYALFGLADCYRGMNQQYRSVEYWNKILEIDPNNKVILTRAGDAYRNTGDYKTATEYYNKAMNIDFDIYAALGLALICKGEGHYEESVERLSALIRNDPKNYRLYIDLADSYLKMNQRQKAIETLEGFQKLGVRSQAINEALDKVKNNKMLS
ncbi:tetratricopeptide repeat protein [Treponema sp.]|uniref:tetratricopeptide repeat protein n=1 Tax=Treponema sp. TaxID=166 RepID=UPI00298DCECD|nr:tetratricopeptide repeat protein [Treponema sp.]MCR5612526.1 tetratricopeptide repeat protein [Treponema sp.]